MGGGRVQVPVPWGGGHVQVLVPGALLVPSDAGGAAHSSHAINSVLEFKFLNFRILNFKF